MEFEKFEMPKVETMAGSEKGSTFLVIAKNKAVRLGIRVFLRPFPVKESMWVALAFRLRAEGAGFTVNKETAVESFGAFPFYESKEHSSAVGIVPLVALPCSPAEVSAHYNSWEGKLETNMLTHIREKVTQAGGTFVISDDLIIESLRETIKDIIPDVKMVANDNPNVLWLNTEG